MHEDKRDGKGGKTHLTMIRVPLSPSTSSIARVTCVALGEAKTFPATAAFEHSVKTKKLI